jgi:hypothetical protein
MCDGGRAVRASRCLLALRLPGPRPRAPSETCRPPRGPGLVDGAEDRTVRNVDSVCPGIDRILDPAWDQHRAHVRANRIVRARAPTLISAPYIRNGGDIYRLSRILGHTQISTTQLYLRSMEWKPAGGSLQVFPADKTGTAQRLGRICGHDVGIDYSGGTLF